MNIEYLHASKFGNGAAVAGEFRTRMATRGATVEVRHIREVRPAELPQADLYVFSSPGRMGRPIGGMRLARREVERGLTAALSRVSPDGTAPPGS